MDNYNKYQNNVDNLILLLENQIKTICYPNYLFWTKNNKTTMTGKFLLLQIGPLNGESMNKVEDLSIKLIKLNKNKP